MRLQHLARGLSALLALGACSSEAVKDGVDEPVLVRNGQFFSGALPGTPPLGTQELDAGAEPVTPTVTSVDGATGNVRYGDPERTFRGRVSGEAFSVAVRFADLGSGYWVAPVSSPDPQYPGEFSFVMNARLSRNLTPGLHDLVFAAIAGDGASGTQRKSTLCVPAPYPDNQNACYPARRPPSLVFSLAWDVDSDLDLQILTPTGFLIDAKNPSGAPDGTQAEAAANRAGGVFERDSNASCSIDGLRVENVVFDEPPPPGEYSIFVNLFDSCRERVTRFNLSVHEAVEGEAANTFAQAERLRRSGQLLDVQANGGKSRGLFVSKFSVP